MIPVGSVEDKDEILDPELIGIYYEVANGELLSSARFAILMRELCQRNGGTFVALPSLRG